MNDDCENCGDAIYNCMENVQTPWGFIKVYISVCPTCGKVGENPE